MAGAGRGDRGITRARAAVRRVWPAAPSARPRRSRARGGRLAVRGGQRHRGGAVGVRATAGGHRAGGRARGVPGGRRAARERAARPSDRAAVGPRRARVGARARLRGLRQPRGLHHTGWLPAPGVADWILGWIWVPGVLGLPLLLLVFPDGRPYWRPVAGLALARGRGAARRARARRARCSRRRSCGALASLVARHRRADALERCSAALVRVRGRDDRARARGPERWSTAPISTCFRSRRSGSRSASPSGATGCRARDADRSRAARRRAGRHRHARLLRRHRRCRGRRRRPGRDRDRRRRDQPLRAGPSA